MPKPPQVFHKLILELYKNQHEEPTLNNQIFRGITNIMPGYWTIVGVTVQAIELMASRNWQGNFTRGLRRDHIRPTVEFKMRLMSKEHSYEEFIELTADYGKCILCTIGQNPAHGAGFGLAYTENDIRWLGDDEFDTARELAIAASQTRARIFSGLM